MAGAVRERWRLVRAPAALAMNFSKREGTPAPAEEGSSGSDGGEGGDEEQEGRSRSRRPTMELRRWWARCGCWCEHGGGGGGGSGGCCCWWAPKMMRSL